MSWLKAINGDPITWLLDPALPGVRYLWPVFQVLLRLPMGHSYFDGMLKKNGAYQRRFARPFLRGAAGQ